MKIGDEVVCIDNTGFEEGPLFVGNTYTIVWKSFEDGYDPRIREYRKAACVELKGVTNPARENSNSHGNYFYADRFEILKRISTETGMAVLKGLLNTKQLEEVR